MYSDCYQKISKVSAFSTNPILKELKFNALCWNSAFALILLLQGWLPVLSQTNFSDYRSVYYYGGLPPDVFMNEPNTQILSRLQQLNCNTVFISFKVSQEEPNNNNLGLYVYDPSANFSGYSGAYCYRDKLTDFIHLASSLPVPIKVFALQLENLDFKDSGWAKAEKKIKKIAYYQRHVRQIFPNKLALLNGVTTNIEPWDVGSITINGINRNYNNNFCPDLTNPQPMHRVIENNIIMDYYLDFAQFIRQKLNYYQFFQPVNPYPVDNKIMGTTHWYMHYFSQRYPNEFPAGNFSSLSSNDRFDYILPQSYCSKFDYECISSTCINTNISSFCNGNYSDNTSFTENDTDYNESTGRCIAWFEKHILTNYMYNLLPSQTIPIDAAPMLFGHSAWMFDTRSELIEFRDNIRYVSMVCYRKANYQGSIIFNYHQAFEIASGNPTGALPICNTPLPDNSPKRTITVYPNPANDVVYFNGVSEGDYLLIQASMNGLKLEIPAMTKLNTSTFQEGWYMILVTDYQGNKIHSNMLYIKH